jgi:hypothetical protein
VTSNRAIQTLAALRSIVGAASWAAPESAGQLFGLDPRANPQSPYLARLFGVRDVALAVGVLAAKPDARRQWLVAGVACDVADAIAGIEGTRAGYLPARTGALVTGTAAGAALLGVIALR